MAANSLAEKVEAIENKANKHARQENIDSKVSQAEQQLKELNRDVSQLKGDLEELDHFTQVLVDVFESEEEHQPASADDAHSKARDAISSTKSEIVDSLDSQNISLENERAVISTARQQISTATGDVMDCLDDIQKRWMSRIGSANGVLRIVGGSREFERTLDDMKKLLQHRMFRDSEDLDTLRTDWKTYMEIWGSEGIDWEEFQKEHGVTDETIKHLKNLSKGQDVVISELSDDVIADLVKVKQISSEIKLTL